MSTHRDGGGEWYAGDPQPWRGPEPFEDTRLPWQPPARPAVAGTPPPGALICPDCYLWEGPDDDPGDSCDMCGEPLVTLAEHAERLEVPR